MIGLISLLVRDYDEAIAFYTKRVGFSLIEDTEVSEDKRWVVVAPPSQKGASLLLAKASGAEQEAAIGAQTGAQPNNRVFLFLYTDNFTTDYERLVGVGVRFLEIPRQEPYGQVAVFEDLYGNRWDLIEKDLSK